jgi:Transposase DDE domain
VARPRRQSVEHASPGTLDLLKGIRQVCRRCQQQLPEVHGNTQVTDPMVLALLLGAFFEPAVRSLRSMDQLSTVPQIQQVVGRSRLPRSTLAHALERFQTPRLQPIVRMLQRRMPPLSQCPRELAGVLRTIAQDGTTLRLAGEVAWAFQRTKDSHGHKDCQAKVHLQVEVQRWTMEQFRVTGRHDSSEPAAMKSMLVAGTLYLMDRGYCGFDLYDELLKQGCHFVTRLKKDIVFRPLQSRPLSPKDLEAGVQSDETGYLGLADQDLKPGNGRKTPPPRRLLRRVQVWDPTHQLAVILITDLREPEAWIIGGLYRSRWVVELYLRWLKITACYAHLFNQSPNGVQVQLYVALIGTLLIHLQSGAPVSKYNLFALGLVAAGRASYRQLLPGLLRLERERMLARARLARKKAEARQQKAVG